MRNEKDILILNTKRRMYMRTINTRDASLREAYIDHPFRNFNRVTRSIDYRIVASLLRRWGRL